MTLIRIAAVRPVREHIVALTLTNGESIERNLDALLVGPVFEAIRNEDDVFRQVRVEDGTLTWPGGADLCPDMVIWGGLPPEDSASVAA